MAGLTTPICVGCEDLFVLCRYEGLARSLLLDWYLGSQKLRKYLRYFAASSLPLRGKPTQARDIARRISGAVAGESTQKVNIPSTHHIPLSPALHYFPFASRFPLPPIHPCRFIRPLSLSSFSIRPFLSACFLFACVLVCLLVVMASPLSSPLSPEN